MHVDVSLETRRRWVQVMQLERAIAHTNKLLESPAAQDDELAQIWQTRLERQQANYVGLMRSI